MLRYLSDGQARRVEMPAAGYVLEPRPTNAVENEDDDEDESDWRWVLIYGLATPP